LATKSSELTHTPVAYYMIFFPIQLILTSWMICKYFECERSEKKERIITHIFLTIHWVEMKWIDWFFNFKISVNFNFTIHVITFKINHSSLFYKFLCCLKKLTTSHNSKFVWISSFFSFSNFYRVSVLLVQWDSLKISRESERVREIERQI
jgi:hypothetical protein